jgi:DedD protein
MEKEQKKLLLVAVSVGVFLLITITAAIVILTPKPAVEGASFSSSQPYPAGRIQTGTETAGSIQTQPGIGQEATVTISREDTNAVADRNNGDITVSIPRAAGVPDNQETPSTASSRPAAVSTPARTTTTAPATTTTTATSRPATTTATTVAASRPAETRPATTTTSRTINDFWVQTGAFTVQVRAEDAKETLASKGITSIIENRIIDGKVWYRVRLGPYTSEREANYWLALVKSIDGFGESQVRQTVRQQ